MANARSVAKGPQHHRATAMCYWHLFGGANREEINANACRGLKVEGTVHAAWPARQGGKAGPAKLESPARAGAKAEPGIKQNKKRKQRTERKPGCGQLAAGCAVVADATSSRPAAGCLPPAASRCWGATRRGLPWLGHHKGSKPEGSSGAGSRGGVSSMSAARQSCIKE